MKLSNALPNTTVNVIKVYKCEAKVFLEEIGINEDTPIKVISNSLKNPLIVVIRGSRWAIDRSMANNIEVNYRLSQRPCRRRNRKSNRCCSPDKNEGL